MQLTKADCHSITTTKSWYINSRNFVDGLTINATVFRNVLLAGRLTSDGQCTGETYSNHIGTWDNLVVQSLVTVTFRDG